MRVAFFEVKDWERTYLTERLPHDNTHFEAGILPNPAAGFRDLDALSVFIYSHVTPQILEGLPNLKFIATRSTGFDHIDLDACRSRGIAVSNTRWRCC
jgi:D-lactate dehydrogenase